MFWQSLKKINFFIFNTSSRFLQTTTLKHESRSNNRPQSLKRIQFVPSRKTLIKQTKKLTLRCSFTLYIHFAKGLGVDTVLQLDENFTATFFRSDTFEALSTTNIKDSVAKKHGV